MVGCTRSTGTRRFQLPPSSLAKATISLDRLLPDPSIKPRAELTQQGPVPQHSHLQQRDIATNSQGFNPTLCKTIEVSSLQAQSTPPSQGFAYPAKPSRTGRRVKFQQTDGTYGFYRSAKGKRNNNRPSLVHPFTLIHEFRIHPWFSHEHRLHEACRAPFWRTKGVPHPRAVPLWGVGAPKVEEPDAGPIDNGELTTTNA